MKKVCDMQGNKVTESKIQENAKAVWNKIQELSVSKQRILAAIDGRCAAGKTTLAACLQELYHCSVIPMDHFFLRPEQRTGERMLEAGGNVDYERFYTEVMLPLKKGEGFSYRPFDCHSQSLREPVWVEPAAVTVIEGSYSCHPGLIDCYDLRVFLTVGKEEQLRRIEKRNGREGAAVFRDKWIPLEERYFSECRIREQCELWL